MSTFTFPEIINSNKIFLNYGFQLARPKYRAKTVEFSTKAVILERDGQLCLIVRACNLRNSLLIDVNVSGKLLKTRRSLDGEWLALEERNVEFVNSNVLFLTQPVDYVHIINEESPLYELSQDVLSSGEPLELIVIMAGKFLLIRLRFAFFALQRSRFYRHHNSHKNFIIWVIFYRMIFDLHPHLSLELSFFVVNSSVNVRSIKIHCKYLTDSTRVARPDIDCRIKRFMTANNITVTILSRYRRRYGNGLPSENIVRLL